MKFSLSLSFALLATVVSTNAYIFDEDYSCSGGWSRHHTKILSGIKSSSASATASATAGINPPHTTPVASATSSAAPTPSAPASSASVPQQPASSSSKLPTTTVSSVAVPSSTNGAVARKTKRGLGFNDVGATTPFGQTVSWAYNWDSQHQGTLAPGVEFAPMLWSDNSDHAPQWAANAAKAIAAGATHLLAFNEPDLSSQANMSPAAAAAAYKKHMQPFAGKAKLVSPAITNGGAPMGTTWLDQFLKACDGCTIDAIAIHIYDSASNVAYFKNYITDIGTKYGKPVWVTEFGASGSVVEQQTFLKTMVPFLENLASVERFSYFGDFQGTFVDNGKLLPLGQTFSTA